jgi:hypothetical protein
MAALREVFAKFGVEFDRSKADQGRQSVKALEASIQSVNKELPKTQQEVKKTENHFSAFAKSFFASGLIAGLAQFVQGVIQNTLAQADQAQALGTTTQSMLEWQHVAAASGVSVEVMNSGLATLSQNMRAVQQGSGDAATTFRRLHVPVRDANRNLRDTGDVMVEAGLAIARIENPTLRARMAVRTFGDAGRQLIPIFEQGATSVEGMRAEVRDMVGNNLAAMETGARKARGEYSRLSLAFQGVSNSIALTLLPSFLWMIQSLTWVVREAKRLADTTFILQAAFATAIPVILVLLGQLLAATWATFGPMIVAMAPFALGVAAIVLVVDELLALFNGGDSIIGRFIDSLLGVGQAKVIVQELRQSYEDLVDWFSSAIDTVIRQLSRIPGISSLVSGLGSAPTVQRQATRGFVAPGTVEGRGFVAPAVLRAGVRTGAISGGSVALGRNSRPNDVRVTTQVGNIVVEGAGRDGEAIATAIQGRLRDAEAASARAARGALVRRVTDPLESET